MDGGTILIVAMGERSVNDSTAFDFARADRYVSNTRFEIWIGDLGTNTVGYLKQYHY